MKWSVDPMRIYGGRNLVKAEIREWGLIEEDGRGQEMFFHGGLFAWELIGKRLSRRHVVDYGLILGRKQKSISCKIRYYGMSRINRKLRAVELIRKAVRSPMEF